MSKEDFIDAYKLRDEGDIEGLLRMWESAELTLRYFAMAVRLSGYGASVYTEIRRIRQTSDGPEWRKAEEVMAEAIRRGEA